MRGDHKTYEVPAHQADATLSQTNPVSGTKYTVLDTTKNARIISIMVVITWATTQPTPLEIHVTIDGQPLTWTFTNPVSDTIYYCGIRAGFAADAQPLDGNDLTPYRAFLLEGRSVKIEAEITWATTQPTPLVVRVKYAKW